jgi:RNA polymerase-binding transcription factor DksA
VAQEHAMNEMTSIRKAALRQMLYGRRQEMQSDVQSRIRHIRHVRTNRATEVHDEFESSDDDIQDDLELALIQMKAETQVRIGEALVRLDAGDEYGYCFDCRGEIAAKRLRGAAAPRSSPKSRIS